MVDEVKCIICKNDTDIPDATKCNRCWELESKLDSLISEYPKVAYVMLLDKAIEAFRKMKKDETNKNDIIC